MALVSYTSNLLLNDIGNYVGLYIKLGLLLKNHGMNSSGPPRCLLTDSFKSVHLKFQSGALATDG